MIEVQHLTKCYGDHAAVDDISFTIENGKIYGFLGPNGAGKSTTMNILTGCLAATSGEVTVGGFDIFEDPEEAKKQIGFLPEIPPVYPESTIREYLTFVARAKGVPESEIKEETARVMKATKITHYENRLIKNLSKGYKQRVGIAQALLGSPEFIILDEPTVGLDPQQIIEIRDLIRSLKGRHTVILSSHILSEVQAVCEEILIINKGKLVANDTAENLEKLFAGKVKVALRMEADEAAAKKLLSAVPLVSSVKTAKESDTVISAEVSSESEDDTALCRGIFKAAADHGTPILQMVTTKASLEDIFIELTNIKEPEAAPEEEVKHK